MQKHFFFFVTLLSTSLYGTFLHSQSKAPKPVPIILDTDIGPDYDDVGAVAVHARPKKGRHGYHCSNKNTSPPSISEHLFGR